MLANEQVSNTVFSALDLHVAILDRDGVIVDVNDVWIRFAAENGGQSAPLGVGANYFDVCRHAASSWRTPRRSWTACCRLRAAPPRVSCTPTAAIRRPESFAFSELAGWRWRRRLRSR